jgi:hypothetical protein
LPAYLWDAKAFPRIAAPVCGIRISVPSMDIRQSLPMSISFLRSKSTCNVGKREQEAFVSIYEDDDDKKMMASSLLILTMARAIAPNDEKVSIHSHFMYNENLK